VSADHAQLARTFIDAAGDEVWDTAKDLATVQAQALLAQAHASLAIAEQLRIANLLGVLAAGVSMDAQDETTSANQRVIERVQTRNLIRAEVLAGLDLS